MEKDTLHCELVLFNTVLKAYPTHHSWIITAHISLVYLDRHIHMFNRQKTLVHQLLVKLQDQLPASQLVFNTLLDEFTNIDNTYESYKPTVKLAVWLLKANSEITQSKRSLLPFLGDALKWLTGVATTRDTWEI